MRVQHECHGSLLLPDFLIVGAAKSATTSLHYYLDQHPGVRMASVKESWFFSFLDRPPRYSSPGVLSDLVGSVADYSALFAAAAPEQKLGDASPSYLYTWQDTLRNLHAVYPADRLAELRIIISLREPVARAWSQYWTFRRVLHEPLSFAEAVDGDIIAARMRDNWNIFYDYIGFGRYAAQVEGFLQAFGRDRVLVLLYEDVQRDPRGVCRQIFEFIGVDPAFVPDVDTRYNDVSGDPRLKWLLRLLKSRNPAKRAVTAAVRRALLALPERPTRRWVEKAVVGLFRPQRTTMPVEVQARLTAGFAPDIRRLERLIGRDLSHWYGGAPGPDASPADGGD